MAIIAVIVIGVLLIASGILFLINPRFIRKMLQFLSKGNRLYGIGIIRLGLGILFLFAANQADIPWIIVTLAIILIISSIIIFAFGPKRLRVFMDFYQQQNDTSLRLVSLVPLILGVIIIYAA